ncbi:MAG: thioredoxin family protein [Dehalococcoidia bacterium]|nr:thioredoxin family protein [Dehalococcoidia bacterium]
MTAQRPGRRQWWNPGWSWKAWAIILAMVFPTVGLTAWVGLAARGESPVDPALADLARANAGSEILIVRGPEHTAYHSLAPLPTEAAPRADGLPTLVFFSAPACAACERMQFVHRVMAGERDRVVFVEKSVDRDPVSAAYGIRETPAFVLIDAAGQELASFGALPDAAAFRAKVDELLGGR